MLSRTLDIDGQLELLDAAVKAAREHYIEMSDTEFDDDLRRLGGQIIALTRGLISAVDENPMPVYRDPNAEHRLGVFETV
jgi:hypothetical protein